MQRKCADLGERRAYWAISVAGTSDWRARPLSGRATATGRWANRRRFEIDGENSSGSRANGTLEGF
jgi:hypothetical protein